MSLPSLKLYGYWRSSASWRVRWAFQLKGAAFEYVPVNILKGENKAPEHLRRNPLGALPVLEIGGQTFLSESLAILEWIEEMLPQAHSLYPGTALDRAHVRSLCEIINSETGPLQTPRAQKRHSDDQEARNDWARDFIRQGLDAFDKLSAPRRGRYAFGDTVTAADLCLVPQLYNALRYNINLAKEFPQLHLIYEDCLETEACQRAAPETQIDAAST